MVAVRSGAARRAVPPADRAPRPEGGEAAGTYRHGGDPAGAAYTYGRYANRTWSAYETAMGELEGGPCLAFASGVAAASAVLGALLRPGDVLVLPSDGYYGVRALAQRQRERGVEVRTPPTTGLSGAVGGAALLWLESPTNPSLDVCDLADLARRAHDEGALVAVDGTTATVLGQRALALGADVSVCSDTKATTGHADLVLGHVAVTREDLLAPLLAWRTEAGAVPGPFETWLAHRSLATLHVRLLRSCANALVLAQALAAHSGVLAVRYPGLPQDVAHEVASRQMSAYGPVLTFTLPDAAAADAWLAALRLVVPATSFGRVQSTAERRGRWGGDAVHPGLVRLSAGLEDPQDLLDDVLGALPG